MSSATGFYFISFLLDFVHWNLNREQPFFFSFPVSLVVFLVQCRDHVVRHLADNVRFSLYVRYSATARWHGEQKHLRSGGFLCVSNVIDRWLPMLTSKEQLADFCSDSLFFILDN